MIILSLAVITACILYLVQNGISLRAAPLIQPSKIEDDYKNVADALTHRLFQQFQNSHYVIWGVKPETPETERLLNYIADDYKKIFKETLHNLDDAENADEQALLNCSKPCWLKVTKAASHRLDLISDFESKIKKLERPFFSITLISFSGDESVPNACERQKRLSFNCLVPISVRSVSRKFRDSTKKYFFLNRYYENNYFLFIQNL